MLPDDNRECLRSGDISLEERNIVHKYLLILVCIILITTIGLGQEVGHRAKIEQIPDMPLLDEFEFKNSIYVSKPHIEWVIINLKYYAPLVYAAMRPQIEADFHDSNDYWILINRNYYNTLINTISTESKKLQGK